MWLLIVTMLATLDMSKATDEYGKVIEPVVEFNDSVFRCVTSVAGIFAAHISQGNPVLSSAALGRDPSKLSD
jgi:hypothetical protein